MDKIRRKNAQKVIVAMSGGIDSSVAAALLKRAGFDIIGVFMKFWTEPEKNGLIGAWNKCCSPEAEKRARKVAKNLKIPFYVFNFEKEFKKRIVDYFLKGYKEGITPNPCVVCNKEIKFGLLLEKALALNADFVATGHYARKIQNPKGARQGGRAAGGLESEILKLYKGRDKEKDQSYFLWQLNQKRLRHILFPVGNYTKTQVKKLAKKFKLPVFISREIPESQEICFIQTTINDFLKRHLKLKPGQIVDTKGKILGQHQGLAFYTIGQRKGIKLSGGPYYVLDKKLKKNLLIVTKNEKDLYKKELIVKKVNWISGKEPKLPLRVKAKIRYRHQPALAVITHSLKSKVYSLRFNQPQRAITPGQSVVFYRGLELLGGGIIC
jgi:tRNA-specific 2-thiouridylase